MSGLVVGYDGTDGARAALDAACALANELSDSVVVVFSHEPAQIGGEVKDYEDAVREHARVVLAQAQEIATAAGADATTEIVDADPAYGLIVAADRHDARMIVVGSYGERPLKALLVGSTPTKLLYLSERPVLVVRAD
jgi:nucleotide-binding universal stress UspA family protein